MRSNNYQVFLYALDVMGHLEAKHKASSAIGNLS